VVNKQKIIAVVGPTASGKSALGEHLAKKLGGTVVSADSRQVYKGMHIISRAERGAMVGVANPKRAYSAGAYAKDATAVLTKLAKRKIVPVVVGGAGFYAEALLRAPLPAVAPNKKLRAVLNKKTPAQLLALLKKLDPASAGRVDPKNKVRLIRAIEIAQKLGSVPARTQESKYEVLWLGLPAPQHYEKVLRRGVAERLRRGMLAEAARLRKTLSHKRYRELGFEFDLLAALLDKEITREEFVEAMVRFEQRYAKRQNKWFKRYKDIRPVGSKAEALRLAKSFLSR
jgi:tRNA dimethylallyltransferase